MGTKGVLCFVVPLGILSVTTGLAAEFKKVQATQVEDNMYWIHCTYHPNPTFILSILSATALVVAEVINISFGSGCLNYCCNNGPKQGTDDEPALSTKRKALLFFSCSTFIIATVLLLRGAMLNDRFDEYIARDSGDNCYVVPSGMFASGALLGALSLMFGVPFYRTINSKGKDANNTLIPNQVDLAMAKA